MDNQVNVDLANIRLEQAKQCLRAAQLLIDSGLYKDSANRSYYAILHSMRAVLALEAIDSKKHSGVIAAFRKRYIKTGKLDAKLSQIIKNSFEVRNLSDYNDFYIVSKTLVVEQLENACIFLAAAENYIENHTNAV